VSLGSLWQIKKTRPSKAGFLLGERSDKRQKYSRMQRTGEKKPRTFVKVQGFPVSTSTIGDSREHSTCAR
jgi:hypothetical protein